MNLSNVDLLSLQTNWMKKDPTTQALCSALNTQFRQLSADIKLIFIYSRLDELDEKTLDELAWQMNIDWYNANADIETKVKFIRTAARIYAHRGTPYAVEQLVKTYFEKSYIQEWFEYGAAPYYFRIVLDYMLDDEVMTGSISTKYSSNYLNLDGTWILDGSHLLNGYEVYKEITTQNNLDTTKSTLLADLNKVKNVRSWLDEILFYLSGKFNEVESFVSTASTNKLFISVINDIAAVIDNNFSMVENERIEGKIIINKLWLLDGTYNLDGTKLLDGVITEVAI